MKQVTVLGNMKRVINGRTYNTSASTLIYAEASEHDMSDAFHALYQTRHGEFFVWWNGHNAELDHGFGPISDEQAKAWLEKYANHLVEEYFGPCPEGGASERRLTIRMPANLANRIERAAAAEGITMNNYAMRCFERCVQAGGYAQSVD